MVAARSVLSISVSWTTSGDDLHHSIDSLGGITEIDLKEAACVDD